MAKAKDVAYYIIWLQRQEESRGIYHPLSRLKLQKLLYYCQGGHYRWNHTRLITDKFFEIGEYGAYIGAVEKKYRHRGQLDLLITDEEFYKIRLSCAEKETIEAVWNQLKHEHAFSLVEDMRRDSAHQDAIRKDNLLLRESDIQERFQVVRENCGMP